MQFKCNPSQSFGPDNLIFVTSYPVTNHPQLFFRLLALKQPNFETLQELLYQLIQDHTHGYSTKIQLLHPDLTSLKRIIRSEKDMQSTA
jgi:hypothetical protein